MPKKTAKKRRQRRAKNKKPYAVVKIYYKGMSVIAQQAVNSKKALDALKDVLDHDTSVARFEVKK